MTIQVLRIARVENLVGLKKSSIYARVKEGTFPAPISLGSRARGWLLSDIEAWLRQCVKTSRAVKQLPQGNPGSYAESGNPTQEAP